MASISVNNAPKLVGILIICAMVTLLLSRVSLSFNLIVPLTSKTIVRGPLHSSIPSRSEPGPESFILVT